MATTCSFLNSKQESSSNFDKLSEIGRGAYGTVYKARDRKSGQYVAMKQIPLPNSKEGVPTSAIREIAALRRMENFEHENIVRFLDVIVNDSGGRTYLTLLFEYIDQDLSSFLEKYPSPSLEQDIIRNMMKQLLSGIDFLHCHKVVHRDLKPQNILVTRNGLLKIADFGLARSYTFQMTLTAVVVTLWYRAPEVILQAQYASPVDLWSCGCIFAELFNRRPLFCGQSEIHQLAKIFEILGLPSKEEWPENAVLLWSSFTPQLKKPLEECVREIGPLAKELLTGLLTINPKDRLSAKRALNYAYFHQTPSHTTTENSNANHAMNSSNSTKNNTNSFNVSSNLTTATSISNLQTPSNSITATPGPSQKHSLVSTTPVTTTPKPADNFGRCWFSLENCNSSSVC
ncbi:cyclin-dependent kinase 4-like isoform X1 [Octopus sinensis]|uniref:cyclin-dependent kinase n=1 Tax=Octopus sinensis TaxID=2607531 RepID=A0A6P7SCM9_9MOLL|nr:cyclin-dependent kinase 4-like isoform X1 [Octopus sinensis]